MKFIKIIAVLLTPLVIFSCSPGEKIISGEIDASEIDVGVKVPGRIAEIYAAEGESVTKGQILGRLESKELDAKLQTVNAALKEAEEQSLLAAKTYARIKSLYETDVIPKQQFDETDYKYNAAKQKVLAVKGQRDEVLAYYGELTMISPIDGEVVQIISNPGELVAAGYPIFTIMNTWDKWAVFNIREDDLKNVRKGETYEVFIPALGEKIQMEATYISALGSFASWKPSDRQGNYDLKTFEVRLKSKIPVEDLRPGMTAVIQDNKK
ncbi:MAG: efflux RND transporter periplasmic adaptor subunit [Endomicrobium sp.]|jgi:HlyD family secretion protein|nr:efflux RND transporter periplasmic adaptor subunit [Endomicrobium sp.]